MSVKFLSFLLKWEFPTLLLNKKRPKKRKAFLIYLFRQNLKAKFCMLCSDDVSADWEVVKL